MDLVRIHTVFCSYIPHYEKVVEPRLNVDGKFRNIFDDIDFISKMNRYYELFSSDNDCVEINDLLLRYSPNEDLNIPTWNYGNLVDPQPIEWLKKVYFARRWRQFCGLWNWNWPIDRVGINWIPPQFRVGVQIIKLLAGIIDYSSACMSCGVSPWSEPFSYRFHSKTICADCRSHITVWHLRNPGKHNWKEFP